MSEENKNIEEIGKEEQLAPTQQSTEIEEQTDKPVEKKPMTISLKSFILSAVAIVVVTAMLCLTVLGAVYQKRLGEDVRSILAELNKNDQNNKYPSQIGLSDVDIIDLLLGNYFYGEVDKDKLTEQSLKAYLAATGDIYAAYYTQEEIDASNDEGAGRMYGIGVNIINSTVTVNGGTLSVLKITNVMKDSPALEAGLKAGDMVVYVGLGENRRSVSELGYDEALRLLKGEEKTKAEFIIFRKNGEAYEEIEFKIERREVITESVYYHVSTVDKKVGVIKITSFELKTPVQFKEAIAELQKSGCEKFVIDVRYNPGGYEVSIAAVLSYFLDEGDVYMRTENSKGQKTEKKIKVVDTLEGDYATCNISKEDIGRFKDLDIVVLANEHTASAAELFTATFKDYELGTVVGINTFGKGKMQTTFELSPFGLEGAVKFTTHMYSSAKSDNYDGVGIAPDVKVELSEEAKGYNIYDIPDDKDNQLLSAIEQFNK